jgi:ABC-type hemin transport system substrate-binding protein
LTFEGTYLLGFGPRVGKAVLELSFALHPEIKP